LKISIFIQQITATLFSTNNKKLSKSTDYSIYSTSFQWYLMP